MSGGGQQQPTQTTTPIITPQMQQIIDSAMPGIKSFAASVPQRYQGPQVAGFNPTQTEAQNQILSAADQAGGVADWAKAGVAGLAGRLTNTTPGAGLPPQTRTPLETSSNIFNDPGIWNPAYNAGTTAAIEAAQRPTWRALTESALPAIRGSAISAGPYGGSRQGIAEGLAINRGTQTAADQAAKIVEDLYGQNLAAVNNRYNTNIGALNQRYGTDVGAETQRYGTDVAAQNARNQQILAAYGMAPSLEQQSLLPGYVKSGVGDVQQQLQQAGINADISNFNYDQLAPFLQSKELLSLLSGFPSGATSTANVPQANPALSALGGAASGAALGSAIMPGIGTGIGAAGGAVLPFLFNR